MPFNDDLESAQSEEESEHKTLSSLSSTLPSAGTFNEHSSRPMPVSTISSLTPDERVSSAFAAETAAMLISKIKNIENNKAILFTFCIKFL